MFQEEQRNSGFMDWLAILSFWIAILNLEQNIEQSKDQDIHKANDKQQKDMLKAIHGEFDEQNQRLSLIEHRLDKILSDLTIDARIRGTQIFKEEEIKQITEKIKKEGVLCPANQSVPCAENCESPRTCPSPGEILS